MMWDASSSKGGEVRKWLFENIYIYVIYITLLTSWF